jgi:hypothetical protein
MAGGVTISPLRHQPYRRRSFVEHPPPSSFLRTAFARAPVRPFPFPFPRSENGRAPRDWQMSTFVKDTDKRTKRDVKSRLPGLPSLSPTLPLALISPPELIGAYLAERRVAPARLERRLITPRCEFLPPGGHLLNPVPGRRRLRMMRLSAACGGERSRDRRGRRRGERGWRVREPLRKHSARLSGSLCLE